MEFERKAVQVTNVQWAKVVVEGIVKKRIVDGKVVWLFAGGDGGRLDCSSRTLGGGAGGRLRVGKEGVGLGRVYV